MRDNSDGTSSRNSLAVSSSRDHSVDIHSSTQTPSSSSSSSRAKTTMASMIPKRYLRYVLVTCLLIPMAILYVTMFQHPPPDEILKQNSGGGGGEGRGVREFDWRAFDDEEKDVHLSERKKLQDNEEDVDEEKTGEDKEEKNVLDFLDEEEEKEERKKEEGREEEKEEKEEEEDKVIKPPPKKREAVEKEGELKGKADWDKFIAVNHYTTIGIVLDTCDKPSQQLGTVILMEDKENGGVMSRTFYNFTLGKELEEGTFNIEVKYNGQDLYDNWWELCEMEDDLEDKDRTFVCPIKKGPLNFVKDKHVPGYLPKGRFQTKAWVKDAKKNILVCGFSDFVL